MNESKIEPDGGRSNRGALSGTLGTAPLPEWEAALRRELERRDPRLLAVYDVYAGQYHRDCTAQQITRTLREKLGAERLAAFAPSHDTVSRLLKQVTALESDYRA